MVIGSSNPAFIGVFQSSESVTPDDDTDNTGDYCIGLYIQVAGTISLTYYDGTDDDGISVDDNSWWPGRVSRVKATGTTASGIHALKS